MSGSPTRPSILRRQVTESTIGRSGRNAQKPSLGFPRTPTGAQLLRPRAGEPDTDSSPSSSAHDLKLFCRRCSSNLLVSESLMKVVVPAPCEHFVQLPLRGDKRSSARLPELELDSWVDLRQRVVHTTEVICVTTLAGGELEAASTSLRRISTAHSTSSTTSSFARSFAEVRVPRSTAHSTGQDGAARRAAP